MSLISDESVFEEEFIPETLVKRKEQIDRITSYLKPILLGRKPPNLLLHGQPGTGKTVTARFVLKKLSRRVNCLYVNCSIFRTFHSVLEHMVTKLRILGGFQQSVQAKLKALDRLFRKPLILVLDEVDWPSPKERDTMLYAFSSYPSIALILISSSRKWLLEADERVRSRLGLISIPFPPYSRSDLMRILRQRARLGLKEGCWDEELLERIVQMADSDIRVAIQTLRNAAASAESSGSERILPQHIGQGLIRARELQMRYRLERLGAYPRMIYRIVRESGLISSSSLFRRCLKACKELGVPPIPRRSYYHHINVLIREGLIEAEEYGERYFRARL